MAAKISYPLSLVSLLKTGKKEGKREYNLFTFIVLVLFRKMKDNLHVEWKIIRLPKQTKQKKCRLYVLNRWAIPNHVKNKIVSIDQFFTWIQHVDNTI